MAPERGPSADKSIIARIDGLSHPLRLAIITAVDQRPASATEIAQAIDEPVDKIRYQLRGLVAAGLVRVAEERKNRGVLERFYVARVEAMYFDEEELRDVPVEKKDKMSATFLKVAFREAVSSLAAGTMTDDSMVIRTPLRLDEQGWNELIRIHREAFEKVAAVKGRSEERLRESGGPMIPAVSVLLFFEMPQNAF
ncbi:MAG TPA: helix-turn-helix domain-containing protein [Solirubrobacterales bacterium]|nr:helix-turn-helix domain-containing protein [Solirubrobacterales bacterium]